MISGLIDVEREQSQGDQAYSKHFVSTCGIMIKSPLRCIRPVNASYEDYCKKPTWAYKEKQRLLDILAKRQSAFNAIIRWSLLLLIAIVTLALTCSTLIALLYAVPFLQELADAFGVVGGLLNVLVMIFAHQWLVDRYPSSDDWDFVIKHRGKRI